jgi:hypothetical protein
MVSPVHGDYRRCQAEIPLIDLFRFPNRLLAPLDDIGAQYHWQLEGFSRVGNGFRNERFPERDAVEKP